DIYQGHYFAILKHSIHPEDVIDWDFLANLGLARNFFDSINTDAFTGRPFRLASIRSGLSRGETVKADHELLLFWPKIGDDEFFIGGTAVKKVRDPRVRLAHRCIATTISGRKESTHRITAIDLFFLRCIYAKGVTCNIPYWLARYLN
ncbi:hypothetical protein Tco_0736040, partial [Tanacetum coccineum]